MQCCRSSTYDRTTIHGCCSFTRIQSTACEQQRFEHLLEQLDPGLLLALALGRCCCVWDCGSRSGGRIGSPRALW